MQLARLTHKTVELINGRGTQFTCFTGTEVQILTLEELRAPRGAYTTETETKKKKKWQTKTRATLFERHRNDDAHEHEEEIDDLPAEGTQFYLLY
jgi:hypothetical protein